MCTWEFCTFWCESRELRVDGKRTLCCVQSCEVDLAGTAYEGADWVHRAYSGLMLTYSGLMLTYSGMMLTGSIGLIVD